MTGVTAQLARFIVASRWENIPQDVRHEAKRALLNWLGCALGGQIRVSLLLVGVLEELGRDRLRVDARRLEVVAAIAQVAHDFRR